MSKNKKRKNLIKKELPPIPNKRYFTISEVSFLCGVKPYVLRYWEQEFTQIRPMKHGSNRRYYQHQDVLLIRHIKKLLYQDGFTIEGARTQLSGISSTGSQPLKLSIAVNKVIAELESVLQNLRTGMEYHLQIN